MVSQQFDTSVGPKLDGNQVFETLRSSNPVKLDELPVTHGIYGLVDHTGEIRYIGVTASPSVGFHNRIFSRHVAGSEGRSHKFSHAYNSGRLWQDRKGADGPSTVDGKIAKSVRAQFCRAYCRAVFFEISVDQITGHFFTGLTSLEAQVQALAPSYMRLWEGLNFHEMEEPSGLLDKLLDDKGVSSEVRAALNRQAVRYRDRRPDPINDSSTELTVEPHNSEPRLFAGGRIKSPLVGTAQAGKSKSGSVMLESVNSQLQHANPDLTWFFMRPQRAQAYGRPVLGGFLVRKGSTAMVIGSPSEKRNSYERDRLVSQGVLASHVDPSLFVFTRDHVFSSSSVAGGVIKDGNCSGPQSWKDVGTGRTLRDSLQLGRLL